MTVVYILIGWTALSIPSGLAFCWLVKTGRIGSEAYKAPTIDDWLERRI